MSKMTAIPKGYHSVGCYLIVPNAIEAMEFYSRAFGAEQVMQMPGFSGENSTMHAEMRIGDTVVMLSDENPAFELKSARTLGGSPVSLHLYVKDVDAAFQRAIDAGCETLGRPSDMFWGDRMAKVADPFGLVWCLATHIEDVSPEMLAQRHQEFLAQMSRAPSGSELA